MKSPLSIITILAFALGCTTGSGDQSQAESAKDLSSVKLAELDGKDIDLSQYKGKAVFINFWATWCKPCIMEMPTIAGLQEKMKNDNVVFLFASREEREEIEAFAKRQNFNFHYVHLENMEALKIQALPTTYIFNPEGKLKFSEEGFRVWDGNESVELIKSIINGHEQ